MKYTKKMKNFIKIFGVTSLLVGAVAVASSLTSPKDNIVNEVSNHAIVSKTLTSNEIDSYQNTIPSWARITQTTVNGNTVSSYSIAELFNSNFDTKEKFEAKYRTNGNLSINKSVCDDVFKEDYKTTNNCAFFISLLYMREINNSIEEGNQKKEVFIDDQQNSWTINKDFFSDDNDEEIGDANYQYLNYQALKKYGFKAEEITAIPYQLAFSTGMIGVLATGYNLSKFPTVAPENVEISLNLAYNPITSYPSTAPLNVNYGTLNLSGTNLNSLSDMPSIFATAETLYIRDNDLDELNGAFINSLANLEGLYIGNADNSDTNNNNIAILPSEFSSIAGNLKIFSAINTGFTSNPLVSYASTLNSLVELDLSSNSILSIGDISGVADTLTKLRLRSAQLTTTGQFLDTFTSLTELDLSQNNLTAISSTTTAALTNLENLTLRDNSLTSLNGLSGLVNLKVLDVSNNEDLEITASDFSTLANLERASLGNTKITASTINFQAMKLIELHLDNLELTEVPISLLNITTLEWISFANNKITVLKLSPYWKRVNYAGNTLTSIDANSLPSWSALVKSSDSVDYLKWTPNLEAIAFSFQNLQLSLMNDPRILKLGLPVFWDISRINNLYTTTDVGILKAPLISLLSNDAIDNSTLSSVLVTTLELELSIQLAQAELNNLNSTNSTEVTYNDINNDELTYSFSKLYKGPENYATINAYLSSIGDSVSNSYSNHNFSVEVQKLEKLRQEKSLSQQDEYNKQRSLVTLILVVVIIALFGTVGGLYYMLKKHRKLEKERREDEQ